MHPSERALLSAALVVLASVAPLGQVGPPVTSPAARLAAGNGVIHGRVVEAGTATGIADAFVTLGSGVLGTASAMFSDGTRGGPRVIAADAEGRFLFRGLPEGSYTVNVTAPGYVNGGYGETRTITIRRTLDLIRRIELADKERRQIAVQLWKLGGIGGQVFDESGDPVVGAQVTVLARMTDWGGPVMQVTSSAVTDDRGAYHVDVTPGDYVVGILAATTSFPAAASAEFQRVQAEGGRTMSDYMNRIVASGGLLPRGIGTRVGNVLVNQLGTLNAPVVAPLLDIDGTLYFYPSAFHPAASNPAAATLVSVASGEEKPGIDVHIGMKPARRVSGRVLGPDGPVAGIALRLLSPDPAVLRTSPATMIDTPQALTGANGEFTFVGVVPGAYTLRGIRAASTNAEPTLWAVMPIAIGDEDVTDLQMVMQTGATVSGKIVVETAAPSEKRIELGAMSIAARPLPGSAGSMHTLSMSSRPDATGVFTTRQTVPGPHMMTVANLPPGFVLKSVTAAGQNIVDKAFELTSAGLEDVVVTISDRVSALTGTVRHSDGAPAPLATIAVFPADKSLWRLPGMASRRVQVAAPGPGGTYSFHGLPGGDYYVAAAEWLGADFSDASVLTALIPSATRVTIVEGETRTADLRAVMR